MEQSKAAVVADPKDPMQSPEVQRRFEYLSSMLDMERDLQYDNRQLMDRDERFYNHKQISAEDAQDLLDRGQYPSVNNVLKKPIDWMIGTERKTRMEYDVFPREEDDSPNVPAKKKYMKYVDDVNKAAWERSAAFQEAAKCGLSWVEAGAQEDTDGEPIFERCSSWRYNWHDSTFRRPDYSDARYHFTRYPLDLDIACSLFPSKKEALKSLASKTNRHINDFEGEFTEDGEYQYSDERGVIMSTRKLVGSSVIGGTKYDRETVDLIVAQYRVPAGEGSQILTRNKNMPYPALTPDVSGEFYDPNNELHKWLVTNGHCSTGFTTRLQTRIMVWVDNTVLSDEPTPYRHNRISMIPVYAYRDETGNFYGEIRGGISAQMDINKRFSKLWWLMGARPIVYNTGAIDDLDEFMEEYAKPDGAAEANDINGIKFDSANFAEVQHHISMISLLAQFIKNGMVPDEGLGIESNAQSGIAIQERKESSSISNYSIFDNYLLSCQLLGELRLSLCEQYVTGKKAIRVTGAKGKFSFESINDTDEQGNPVNDIVSRQADFMVRMVDYRDSVRVAAAEAMMALINKLPPDMAAQMFPLAVTLMDFEDKDEFLAQMRKILKQKDPDDESQEPTPEEQAAAEEQQLAMETARAQLAELTAKVKNLEADAALKNAKVGSEQVTQNVKTAGVEYDERMMKVIEAKALTEIRGGDVKTEKEKLGMMPRPYQERGLKSNNQ